MRQVDLIVAGKLTKGPFHTLVSDYTRRIQWPLKIFEIESKHKNARRVQDEEATQILAKIAPSAFVVALDERGNGLKSLDFARTLQNLQNSGESHIQFIIGGADGLTNSVRDQANMLLSFGQQTWPHMMARVMLLEQIYRAQQILAGHPYHRE
ncbi:MAG: 23S rRNA (pseudouridine(1915)-N(3))-methyltransferase RlmH [Alphaproteobacteria bacterium]